MKNVLILRENEIKELLKDDIGQVLGWMEEALSIEQEKIVMPEKSSQVFNEESKERVNCMPATLLDYKVSGVKLISVFPNNRKDELRNVNGALVLNEISHGFPIAFMDAAYLTLLRTAAIGVVASKYLARSEVGTVGFIGAGEQAQMHFYLLKMLYPQINTCYISSISNKGIDRFIEKFEKMFSDVKFVSCEQNYDRAVCNADIIITATSAQEKHLRAKSIKKGAFYIHVGGVEDEYNVALSASKIVCDCWNAVKHREQTISVMYKEKILKDEDIYADLSEIVRGEKKGRSNDNEFIYFNSVGLSYIDIYFGFAIYKLAIEKGFGLVLDWEE